MLVSYVFSKPFGSNAEGDLVQLDPDEAQTLVDAGFLSEATQEHLTGTSTEEEDAEVEDMAMSKSLSKTIENSIIKATELAVSKSQSHQRKDFKIPATVRSEEVQFKSFGEACVAAYHVYQANKSGRWSDGSRLAQKRLNSIQTKAPLGSSEGVLATMGYGIREDWMTSIFDKVRTYPRLLDMCDKVPVSGNTLNIPSVSEATLNSGQRHAGVQSFWTGEGNTITSSTPTLGNVVAVVKTNVVLNYLTNQVLDDFNIESAEKFVGKLAAEELLWAQNEAVINGNGTTEPRGVMNQASLVTVTKSSNDANGTGGSFGFDDLVNMRMALWPSCEANAVWVMHPQALGMLERSVFVSQSGTATTYPAFGGVSFQAADPFPRRIFGIPVISCLNCAALGSLGDVLLIDPSQLIVAEKTGGIQFDISDQVQFATLQTALRFVQRFDIQSGWLSSVSYHGGTYSPFICLSARAT